MPLTFPAHARPSVRLSVLAVCAAAAAMVLIAGAMRLPYPVLTDLDSSFVSFLNLAYDTDLRAGVGYVFTYGPLGPWYHPMALDERWFLGTALRMLSALAVAVYLWVSPRTLRGAVLSVGTLFVLCLDDNSLMLGPLLVLVLVLADRRLLLISALVVVATLWGLAKFSGLIALAACLVFGVAAAVALRVYTLRDAAAVLGTAALAHAGTVLAVYVGYLGQSPLDYFSYVAWSAEIARGFSHYMGVGERPVYLQAFAAATVVILALHAWTLWRTGERPAGPVPGGSWSPPSWLFPTLCVLPVLFIAMKQGFTRQDGHEAAAFGILFVYLSAILVRVPAPGLVVLPAHGVVLAVSAVVITALQVHGYAEGRVALRHKLLSIPAEAWTAATMLAPGPRADIRRQLADQSRSSIEQLAREVPLVAGMEGFDIFAPEQTLALIKPGEYRPRPVFQGYSAYTPALQDLNAAYTARAPDDFLVRFRPIDGRMVNLEDGSALAQIMMRFCPAEWNGAYVQFRRKAGDGVDLDRLDWVSVPLHGAELPPGPVLGYVDIQPSMLGRLFAALYRLPAIFGRFELSDGSQRTARIIPSGREYPAFMSPWLESTWDLRGLWSGDPMLTIRRVTLGMDGFARSLIDGVTLRYAPVPRAAIADGCSALPAGVSLPPLGAHVQELPGGHGRLLGIEGHPNRMVAVPLSRPAHVTAILKLRVLEKTADLSDGVDVRIYHYADGAEREIFSGRFGPGQLGRRGRVKVFDGPVDLRSGFLIFETRDADPSWDWYSWDLIELR